MTGWLAQQQWRFERPRSTAGWSARSRARRLILGGIKAGGKDPAIYTPQVVEELADQLLGKEAGAWGVGSSGAAIVGPRWSS